MASPGQTEFIEDLMRKHDIDSTDVAEMSGNAEWEAYDTLPDEEASDMIFWLKDLPQGRNLK